MSNLVEHAKRELELSGVGDDYDGMIGKAVIQLIETFANQGHSGYSAEVVTSVFSELVRFRNLGPLTDNPDEWMKVGGPTSQFPDHPDQWQSRRRHDAFSDDGGKTFILLDEISPYGEEETHKYTSEKSHVTH